MKAGKLQSIAISSAKRSPAAPDVPTLAETYPDCVGEVWAGLFAPTGVNPEILKTLQTAMAKVMARPDVRERLTLQGLDLTPVATNKLAGFLNDEITKWARIVKASGAHLD